jgi:threonine/homoserine/homoserine lactone efflux protein
VFVKGLVLRILLIGIVLGFATCAPIGPTNIALMQRGLRCGFGAAWWFGAGAVAADMLLFILVYLGAAPFLLEIAWLKLALWTAGAGYLAYLGVGSIRSELNLEDTDNTAVESLPRTFASGFGVNILNPSALASWLVVGGSALGATFNHSYAGSAWLLIAAVARWAACCLWRSWRRCSSSGGNSSRGGCCTPSTSGRGWSFWASPPGSP